MTLIADITAQQPTFAGWRQALHQNPGLGFEEDFAAALVAEKLAAFGLDEVHPGIGRTGVVGVLRGNRASNRAIGLRADMDALPIQEETGKPWASTVPGVMHACGHDGHTATLLAAAWYLARTRDFAGTVHFIFQPAEEGRGGAAAMLADGLLDRFPCDRVHALHNMPGLPLGHIHTRPGRMMTGNTQFTIRVEGRGGHAALPHTTIDCTQIACNIVLTAQSIVGRNLIPTETGVLSFSDVRAVTDSHNVIPGRATLKGCMRYYDGTVRDLLKQRLDAVAQGIAATYGGTASVAYDDNFDPLVNDAEATASALAAAVAVVGPAQVRGDIDPFTASEDFAFMSQRVPGSYVFVGAGPGAAPHHPAFDFNDAIIPVGASYFARLVQAELT